LVGSDCIRFRVDPEQIHPKYFFHFLRSEITQNWIQGQAYGTIMPGINEKILGRLMANIPSLDDQSSVAAEFDDIESSLLEIKLRVGNTRSLKLATLRHTFDGGVNVQ
jgi:restriction endonuclease S subunit